MSDPSPRSTRRPAREHGGIFQAVLRLTAAQQRTAAAALVVLVSLGTPWYSTEVVFPGKNGGPPSTSSGSMTGIGAFSFVEAAVLLVGVAVLLLVWARATNRVFSLPFSDGTVVTAAAGWLGLLVVYRLFDKPDGDTEGGAATLIGLSWGIFATLAAVGLLLATGLDQRRRDAELRAETADPADGPVVDPADVVPPSAADDRTEVAHRAGERDGPRQAPAPQQPTWDGPQQPSWDGPQGSPGRGPGDDRPPAAERSRVPAEAPPTQGPPSRSWSYADADGPGPPPPRIPPSRRRPTPPTDATRPLGRGDAAEGLRDAGVGGGAARSRGASGEDDRRPTAWDENETRVARRDDPTRVAPRSPDPDGAQDPPQDDRPRGRRRPRDR